MFPSHHGFFERTNLAWYLYAEMVLNCSFADNNGVGSKLKCPLFVARDMSGFIVNQQQSGLWESGNPAGFAGFPSGVGKSAL